MCVIDEIHKSVDDAIDSSLVEKHENTHDNVVDYCSVISDSLKESTILVESIEEKSIFMNDSPEHLDNLSIDHHMEEQTESTFQDSTANSDTLKFRNKPENSIFMDEQVDLESNMRRNESVSPLIRPKTDLDNSSKSSTPTGLTVNATILSDQPHTQISNIPVSLSVTHLIQAPRSTQCLLTEPLVVSPNMVIPTKATTSDSLATTSDSQQSSTILAIQLSPILAIQSSTIPIIQSIQSLAIQSSPIPTIQSSPTLTIQSDIIPTLHHHHHHHHHHQEINDRRFSADEIKEREIDPLVQKRLEAMQVQALEGFNQLHSKDRQSTI